MPSTLPPVVRWHIAVGLALFAAICLGTGIRGVVLREHTVRYSYGADWKVDRFETLERNRVTHSFQGVDAVRVAGGQAVLGGVLAFWAWRMGLGRSPSRAQVWLSLAGLILFLVLTFRPWRIGVDPVPSVVYGAPALAALSWALPTTLKPGPRGVVRTACLLAIPALVFWCFLRGGYDAFVVIFLAAALCGAAAYHVHLLRRTPTGKPDPGPLSAGA